MNNIDFDLSSYSFDDILNLFKLTTEYNEIELIKAKNILNKMHPDNSNLDIKYYNLFLEAYKIIQNDFKFKKQSLEKYDEIINIGENNTLEKEELIISPSDLINSCYVPPSNYIEQIMSIHTEDRDIMKYPLQNNFSVELPQVFKNVISLELYDITLPTYYYNISEILQNTRFWFSIPIFFIDPIELKMESGNYNITNFINSFIEKLNETTGKQLFLLGIHGLPTTLYTSFDASYNNITNRITIFNNSDNFIFWCEKKSFYKDDCLYDNFNMSIDWGLPFNLGFNKQNYISIFDPSLNVFVLYAPNQVSININNTIYMEIEKFNYINENTPFTISPYYNDYSGKVNSAFAKLILSNVTNTYVPVTKFKRILPHIEEKIGSFKFRFRYHNGNLVDFLNQEFNFSLKMICKFGCKF
jgi:hypothetical protein